MRGVLQEVGIADVLHAYVSPSPGQLTCIDGHLRKSLGPQPWPVLLLDVNDAEAAYLLATYEELAPIALRDQDRLAALLGAVQSEDEAVQQLLRSIAEREGITPPAFQPVGLEKQGRLDQKAPVTCPECGAEFVP
jgi:hypothetical protein